MSKTYRAYEPEQMYLMPPSLAQWLPSDHMVYFIRDIVDTIDIKPITRVYEEEERGYPPYHPKVMIGLDVWILQWNHVLAEIIKALSRRYRLSSFGSQQPAGFQDDQ